MSKKSAAERRQLQRSGTSGSRNGGGNGRAGSGRGGQGPRSGSRYRGQGRNAAKRPWGIFAAIGGVVAVFVVLILVFDLTASPVQDTAVLPVPASVLSAVTHVPTSELDQVGGGSLTTLPQPIPASDYNLAHLTAHGLPVVLYVGAEYCPFCAYTRWALIAALSRFGSFANLHIIRSSVTDSAGPNIATFTFAHGSSYSSKYVAFEPRELQSNVFQNGNYTGLQSLNAAQAKIFETLDPKLGYPFVDFGGKTGFAGMAASAPTPLVGYTWQQIATDLANPKSAQAQDILGGANDYTAAICMITGQKPGGVCSSSVIQSLEKKL